jgi:hypothetical protein
MGYVTRPARTIEDIPSIVREYFFERILQPLIFIDMDKRYKNPTESPLGIKELIEDVCYLIGRELPENYRDSWYCTEILSGIINEVPWYNFYDILERIGYLLKIAEKKHSDNAVWINQYGFLSYVLNINAILDRHNIGWNLHESGEFQRETPVIIIEQERAAGLNLTGKYEPARIHLTKALRFIRTHPLDPENAIKEIVSAVESVARIQFVKSSTLGQALKELRNTDTPTMLIDIIEKYYGFANAEPGVRHGGRRQSLIDIEEAELCVQIGVAVIRYLLSIRNEWTQSN